METNEIMNNEEVIETAAEEITKKRSGKGVKIAAGVGLAVLAGIVIYRYVGKPMLEKIKARKEFQVIDKEDADGEFVDAEIGSEEI